MYFGRLFVTCVPFNENKAFVPYDVRLLKSILKKHKHVVYFGVETYYLNEWAIEFIRYHSLHRQRHFSYTFRFV